MRRDCQSLFLGMCVSHWSRYHNDESESTNYDGRDYGSGTNGRLLIGRLQVFVVVIGRIDRPTNNLAVQTVERDKKLGFCDDHITSQRHHTVATIKRRRLFVQVRITNRGTHTHAHETRRHATTHKRLCLLARPHVATTQGRRPGALPGWVGTY